MLARVIVVVVTSTLLVASNASAQRQPREDQTTYVPPPAGSAPRFGDEPGDVVGRVALELLVGALGYAIGAGAGGLLGCGIGIGFDAEVGCTYGAIVGGIIGAGFGIAAGVTVAGDLLGANGRFWPAYGGQFLGGLMSLALVPFADEHPEALLVAMIALPLIGGVRGYEGSNRHPRYVRAALAPTRRGARADLAITF